MQTGRLLIYNISDRAGVVDDYIYHMLDELDKYVDKIVVVSEGTLRQEAKKKLAFYAEKILEYPSRPDDRSDPGGGGSVWMGQARVL